jgi:hypothetical protein
MPIIEGFVPVGREKFYLDVPFEMPPGVARLAVRYRYSERIGSDPHLSGGNTVDIGLFDWRGDTFLDGGFRGWTGSNKDEFYITPTDATRGYMPGPLEPGTWHITLGFYKVGPNGCHYTVEVEFTYGEDAVTEFPPMLTLDSPNQRREPSMDGWYKGELHCHTIHSDGDSTAAEVIAAAHALDLDFLAITDHNNVTHLMEMAMLGIQPVILIPGFEVTTYRGHRNVWGIERWVDFRVEQPDDMQHAVDFARQHVYLTSLNHPRPFGPPWEYEGIRGNQCVEVWNGSWEFQNDVALDFWEQRLRAGEKLVAVGGSDMHRLKRADSGVRLGMPTTWIYCPGEPTARGLLSALRAGHAFLSDGARRLFLNAGGAMMGDTISRPTSGILDVSVRVMNGDGLELQLISSEGILATYRPTQGDETHHFRVPVTQSPYIRAQLVDPNTDDLLVHALTNPIYIE